MGPSVSPIIKIITQTTKMSRSLVSIPLEVNQPYLSWFWILTPTGPAAGGPTLLPICYIRIIILK